MFFLQCVYLIAKTNLSLFIIIGNKRFREVVLEHKEAYRNAPKLVKPRVALKVVKVMRTRKAKFLRKEGKFWIEVGDRHAAMKASQALREKPWTQRMAEGRDRDRSRIAPPPLSESREGNPEILKDEAEKAEEVNFDAIKKSLKNSIDEFNNALEMEKGEKSKKVGNKMSTGTFPSLPPSFPGVLAPPYAYYPMHSGASAYPPIPPYYGMPHPTQAAPFETKVEGGKEAEQEETSKQITENDESNTEQEKTSKQIPENDDSNAEQEKTSNQETSPEVSKTRTELLEESLSTQQSPTYRKEGGIFGECDEYGDIIVTERDVLCGRGGVTNHHKV